MINPLPKIIDRATFGPGRLIVAVRFQGSAPGNLPRLEYKHFRPQNAPMQHFNAWLAVHPPHSR